MEAAIENLRVMVTATFTGLAIYQLMTVFESRWEKGVEPKKRLPEKVTLRR
tara:strand:+ start:387 stop:539 length:153 start_codon:yes stop_codon:yes gene_type:complete